MKRFLLEVSKGRFKVSASAQEMGPDVLVSVWGGTRPHIGAVGMGIPRPSLKDPATSSATSSNFTFVGHKEDTVVKEMSEKLAARLKRNVVVTAGIHWDNLSPGEIKMIQDLTEKISDQILKKLQRKK